jgi:hypothetical protein
MNSHGDHFGDGWPPPQTFLTILGILLKEIVDLRETLEFYELHLCDATYADPFEPIEDSGAGCTVANMPELAGTFG